jgi:hypothetical protein
MLNCIMIKVILYYSFSVCFSGLSHANGWEIVKENCRCHGVVHRSSNSYKLHIIIDLAPKRQSSVEEGPTTFTKYYFVILTSVDKYGCVAIQI